MSSPEAVNKFVSFVGTVLDYLDAELESAIVTSDASVGSFLGSLFTDLRYETTPRSTLRAMSIVTRASSVLLSSANSRK